MFRRITPPGGFQSPSKPAPVISPVQVRPRQTKFVSGLKKLQDDAAPAVQTPSTTARPTPATTKFQTPAPRQKWDAYDRWVIPTDDDIDVEWLGICQMVQKSKSLFRARVWKGEPQPDRNGVHVFERLPDGKVVERPELSKSFLISMQIPF